MDNREQLEHQLKDLEAQKVVLFDSGSADPVEVGRLNEQIKGVRQQLSAMDSKEAIIMEAQNPESSFTLTVEGYTVDFRAEASSEESYQALSIVTQLKLQELEEQNQAEIKALKASYETERQQFELQIGNLENARSALQQTVEEFKQENAHLDDRLYDANLQISDLESKRAIAANEIESLKSQVEELRNQVSKPAAPTNLDNGALSEAMRKLKESKRAIYNVVNDNGNVNFTARYADTDAEFTDKLLYIGKYRVLKTQEEVQRFRTELEAAEAARKDELESTPDATPEAEITPEPVEDFRNDLPAPDLSNAHDGDNVVGNEPVSEGAQDHDGESFEQEVRRRLARLENEVFPILTLEVA